MISNLCSLSDCLVFVSCLLSSLEPVGSWFIPGSGPLCPPASSHSQFGSPISLSPSHSCERYSTLRNHRSTPYTSPYSHRTNSPSECPPPPFCPSSPSLAFDKKLKCCWVGECSTFLLLLCEWSHRAVKAAASDEGCPKIYLVENDKISFHFGIFVWVAAGYSENSSSCLSMLTSHENWSGLQVPTHTGVMPVGHNSHSSGANSRFDFCLLFRLTGKALERAK